MSTSPSFDDEESPLTAEGQNDSIDERTIAHTPVPMAASTAGRHMGGRDGRYAYIYVFKII